MVKKVFTFSMSEDVDILIDDYRRQAKPLPSRSEAVEQIIRKYHELKVKTHG
jgi:metal-responsive CopG/Arc/MetJ family transcriptional regulator